MRRSFSFTQKILFLPAIAAVALLLVLVLTISFGNSNQGRLQSIRGGYYLSVQASRDLQETLVGLQRSLQDAVTARDIDRLEEADSLSQHFQQVLAGLRRNPVADSAGLDSLRAAFDTYYVHARETSNGSGSPGFMPSGVALTTRSNPAGSLDPVVTCIAG